MKKIFCNVSLPERNAAIKRSCNRKTKNIPQSHKILAPSYLDLYSERNHQKFVGFIKDLKEIRTKKNITICFRNTTRITAAAGLLLVSEVDSLLKKFPETKIICTLPTINRKGHYKQQEFYFLKVCLEKIGFFKLLKYKEKEVSSVCSCSMLEPLKGIDVSSMKAGQLMLSIQKQFSLSNQARSTLYRGVLEAMANSVEHAYNAGHSLTSTKWWMFVGVFEKKLTIIVCDLGVGIPKTLPKNHSKSVLKKIFSLLGENYSTNSDGALIRASTYIKRTRTEEDHRGKGGNDLRSLIEYYPQAILSIYSNKGTFTAYGQDVPKIRKIRGKRPLIVEREKTYSQGIEGTIIEWTIPINSLEQS